MKIGIFNSIIALSLALAGINTPNSIAQSAPQLPSHKQELEKCQQQVSRYVGYYEGKATITNYSRRVTGKVTIEVAPDPQSACGIVAKVEEFKPLGGKGTLRGSFSFTSGKKLYLAGTMSHQSKPKVWDVQMEIDAGGRNSLRGTSQWTPKRGVSDTKIYIESFTANRLGKGGEREVSSANTPIVASAPHLIIPPGSGLKLTKVEQNNADFKNQIWVTGMLVAQWLEGDRDVPDYSIILDAASSQRLPYFSGYRVRRIDIANGRDSLQMAVGSQLANRVSTRRVEVVKARGSFLIKDYQVGGACDSPWARATVIQLKVKKPIQITANRDGGGC